MAKKPKFMIGWREYVDLPEWHVRNLKVKVDTGARSSCLHVENIVEFGTGNVKFDIVMGQKNRHRHIKTKIVKKGYVKSSNGQRTKRLFVKTLMKIGPIEKEVYFSLVDRTQMNFRALLGRKALEDDFIVDVNRSYILGNKH